MEEEEASNEERERLDALEKQMEAESRMVFTDRETECLFGADID